jgi:hypothetical protein
MRFYAGSLQVLSRPQYLRFGQLLAGRRDFSPSYSRPGVDYPRLSHDRILMLALVGCLFAILALGPQDVANSMTGEAMSPLLNIGLRSGDVPVFGRAETQQLTIMASLVFPSATPALRRVTATWKTVITWLSPS